MHSPRRAVLARSGPLRFSPNDESPTDPPFQALSDPYEATVVEERERSVRIVVADEHLRIVVFASRAALQPVTTRSTWLARAPDRAPDSSSGVRLAPGVAVNEQARERGRARIAG
jgi:hypothetical protein